MGEQIVSDAALDITVEGVSLVDLPKITGELGSLIVAELGAGMPFAARRIFTLLDIPSGQARGIHAHRECAQFLICMRGSVRAVVDDGTHRQEILLDSPTLGLHMPAMTWGTQYDYSPDAILVVLASEPYDAADYIEDYEEFVRLRQAR
jgi:UDP-2-acetamido-3-amino-2,3-dideoxy-glucuronate N-acetyltransferase